MEAAHEEVVHKHKHHKHHHAEAAHIEVELPPDEPEADAISFWHDFIAGGVAGSASVVVGHPFDTVKVRMQTSTGSLSVKSFGGPASLFRGMGAPLSAATFVNAIIFSTYGTSSRLYDQYLQPPDPDAMHDPSQKAFLCGSLAGLVQCVVVCPMEHIKCRLQIQHGKGSPDEFFKGPRDAIKSIVRQHGIQGLYRGWCATCWREVPAFGMYFAFYDIFKDKVNTFLAEQVVGMDSSATKTTMTTSTGSMAMTSETNAHTWFASALAGGATGALTWGLIYPIDIIKTKIQTSPWDTPLSKRRIVNVAQEIVQTHGWRHLFRGLNITLIRAFPVNGIIFPVYEFTLMHIAGYEH